MACLSAAVPAQHSWHNSNSYQITWADSTSPFSFSWDQKASCTPEKESVLLLRKSKGYPFRKTILFFPSLVFHLFWSFVLDKQTRLS